MTLAKHRNVVNIFLICFNEMFYRNFFTLNVLKTASESVPISTAILNFRVKLDGSPTDSRMYKNNSKEI